MDPVFLSRLQFAAATMFHFLFVPLTLGLSVLVAYMETRYARSGDETYLRMTKFWGKLFLINFALGVVTGITLEFQFGTNWSRYSAFVGDIFGSLLAIEATVAFFLESILIGVWVFGWKKLSRKAHAAVMWLIAGAGNISALWILIANGWMQQPVGYVLRNGRAELNDFAAVVLNKFALLEFFHTVPAAFILGSFFVMGISALFFLVHGALWLAIRTSEDLHERAVRAAGRLWLPLLLTAVAFLAYSAVVTDLYANYLERPYLFVVILAAVFGLVGIKWFLAKKQYFRAWFASALAIAGATFFGIVGLFPNMLLSSINADYSLTALNASSSPMTLKIMLVVVLLFVPLVLTYQIWAYHLFHTKLGEDDLALEDAY